jgi:hypothetical protein
MVWKLIFYAHMAGLLDLGTYSDLSECQRWAAELNKEKVWSSEYRYFDLSSGETNMSYRCVPVPG